MDERRIREEERKENKETGSKDPKDTPQKGWGTVHSITQGGRKDKQGQQKEITNDLYELTDGEDEDSADGQAETKARIREGPRRRHYSLGKIRVFRPMFPFSIRVYMSRNSAPASSPKCHVLVTSVVPYLHCHPPPINR